MNYENAMYNMTYNRARKSGKSDDEATMLANRAYDKALEADLVAVTNFNREMMKGVYRYDA